MHNDNKKEFSVNSIQSSSESLLKNIRHNTKHIFIVKKLEAHRISHIHELLDNLTPRHVYIGQGVKIKKIRETIKRNYQHKGKSAKIYMRIEFYQIAIAKKL